MSTPTLPTDHDDYEALAVAWALNALEPADQAMFEAHRDECDRCTQAAFRALETATELAYGVPDVAPPARLRERILVTALPDGPNGRPAAHRGRPNVAPAGRAAPGDDAGLSEGPRGARAVAGGNGGRLADRRVEGPPGGSEPGRRPRGAGPRRMARATRGPRRLAYALAAAVLVAGSAVTTWEMTRPAAATDRIAVLSAGGATIATVVAHQHGADVVTDMLPPNAGRGTAYYVWGVPAQDGGTPQVVGIFEVTTTGLHSYPLRLTRALHGYPVLAISEETAGSSPSAPSSVLGNGTLSSSP
jgi:anti-sigma-K factor RskA